MTKFAQVLDSAADLAVAEQESLDRAKGGGLRRPLGHDLAGTELVAAVKSARREFKEGRCRPATPAQIVKRLLA